MKLILNIIRLCSAALLIPAVSSGCELCGSYVGAPRMDNQNTFSIVHRFRVYNGYRSLNQQGAMFPSGSYRYVQPPSVLHGSPQGDSLMSPNDFESYKHIEFRGRYFIHERIQLGFILPLVNNKANSIGKKTNVWGVGDISLCIGYRLIQSPDEKEFRQRMLLGLGVKFPTGSSSSTFDDGDRLPFRMQPGSGSYDALMMVTYAASWKSWLLGLTSHNRLSSQNRFYEQMAPMTSNTLVIAKAFGKESCQFYPQLQVYHEFTSGVWENGTLAPGTRMNNLLCGPGFEFYCRKFGVGACAQFPIYQDVYRLNMELTWRLMVGVSYNFNSDKYVFQ